MLEAKVIDQRFKEALEKDLKAEIKKGEEMLVADVRGQRVSKRFAEVMQSRMNEIAQITDSQVLLTKTISLLRDSASILDDIISESNITRREQQARAEALKDYHTKFIKMQDQIAQEEKAKEEALEAANEEAISPGSRKIGERPEKLKNIRGTQDSENQPSFLPQQ